MRSPSSGSLPIRRRSFVRRAFASGSENVVEKNAAVEIGACQKGRSVERNDRLPGTGRTGDAGRAIERSFHQCALGRVEEDCPLLPRELHRARQLLDIVHHPEAAQGVGMLERIGTSDRPWRRLRSASCR